MNKILITIQGRTLILYYQVNSTPRPQQAGRGAYIEVLPSPELAHFNLKGLTPAMFCVNIADMVNIHGLYSGTVENERQAPVAKWEINAEEYLLAANSSDPQLTHHQIVELLKTLPGYTRETQDQYIEFEERVVPHADSGETRYSGYRLTILTEEIEHRMTSSAFYYLDTWTQTGWQDYPPSQEDCDTIQDALKETLMRINEAGVLLSQISDETDYAITDQG